MKALLSTLFVCMLLGTWAQDLPIENPGFETWDYYNTWTLDPLGWTTGNFQLADHVYPDSSAFEGEVALRVYPITFFESIPGFTYQELSTTFIPANFSFAVKCNIDGLDSVFVRLSFMNGFNPVYTKTWSSDLSIQEWQAVNLDLDQIEPIMDGVRIEVIAGYGEVFLAGSPETWISVDAMGFEQTDGISEKECEAKVFPNPTNGPLTIQLCASNSRVARASVYNGLGQIVFEVQNQNRFDLGDLPSGVYTLELEDSAGNTSR